jgi:ABC-2 type transport system ATP-binding protein
MKAVEIRNVDKIYKQHGGNSFYALKNLTINVEHGHIFCLLGPNGSGKTTTINLINGLIKATNGSVSIMQNDPIKNTKKVRSLIGVVPQETALYNDLTARENLLFHAQYYGVEKSKWNLQINSMLDLVGLSERQKDRVGTYSGGMQRRLALARALLTSPQIILLDEPTLGVDVHSRNSIWNRIKSLAKEGKTIFLTTNYMEEAEELADTIAIIDRGQNVITGTLQQLKDNIGQHKVIINFDKKDKAEESNYVLKQEYKTSLEKNKIFISLSDKKQFYEILHKLGKRIEQSSSFSMMEPTLNDIFLNFTGRELRD